MSDGRSELVEANIKDFSSLPTAMCFVPLAVKSRVSEKVTLGGIQTIQFKRNEIKRFTLSADCTNSVQFDRIGAPRELTDKEMEQIHAP